MSQIRNIKSTPALSSMESQPLGLARHRRYMSVSDKLGAETNQLKMQIRQTAYMAVPGMGSTIRRLSKQLSHASLAHLQSIDSHLSHLSQDDDDAVTEMLMPELETRVTFSLQMAVFVATLSAFQVGYNTSVINVPATIIKAGLVPGQEVSDLGWSVIVSLFCVGGLLGSYAGGVLGDKYGRKRFLLGINAFFILGGILETFATSVWMMALGRLLIGAGSGGTTVVVPLYLGEISPAQLRGTLGTLNQFTIVVGILIACVIGKPLGTPSTWRVLMGVTILPALLQLVCSPLLTESPRWLVSQGRKEEARNVVACLTDGSDEAISFIVDALEASMPFDEKFFQLDDEEKQPTKSDWAEFSRPLLIGLGLQAAQQFSGINAVFYYSTSFFKAAHVEDPWMGSVLACAVNVLATGVAVQMMDRVGRRGLLLWSSMGMFASTILLTAALYLNGMMANSQVGGYLSVFSMLLFVTFFELGLGPIPWLISAEIFPANVSSKFMTATCSLNWITNFIVGLSFPSIQQRLGNLTFVPFGAVCLLCFLGSFKFVPETKGKTLEEIQEELKS